MENLENKIKEIIVDKLGIEESEITDSASFTNDLGADSLDTVELIMEFEKEFNVSNPFDFMDMINLQGKTNFFEKRVSEYQKAGVLNNDKKDESNFGLDDDF